jgi:hypothetical protein
MKTNPDFEDPLLDAVLGDDEWQAVNAAAKAKAMGAFHARQRRRRFIRGTSGIVALTAILAGGFYWVNRPTNNSSAKIIAVPEAPAKQPKTGRTLSDEQLLAAFPPGSCFIAEVNGRKELVFLEPEVERLYVAK